MMITFNVNLLRLTNLGMCNILYYYFAIRIHLNTYLIFGLGETLRNRFPRGYYVHGFFFTKRLLFHLFTEINKN